MSNKNSRRSELKRRWHFKEERIKARIKEAIKKSKR
jgi:hypothetical protein